MLKKLIAACMICGVLLASLGQNTMGESRAESMAEISAHPEFSEYEGSSLDDEGLRADIEDQVYQGLLNHLDTEKYYVENVESRYVSREYLEELAYNSQTNIFFGYSLKELVKEFEGEKYIFTLSDDGGTTVQKFQEYDDTYDRVFQNVAIGSGVILVCVTVSVVTGGTAPAVSMIFALSAKTGAIVAVSSGGIGGIAAGIVTAVQTNDTTEALKAAALAGSEGFKWGAISGAVAGGATEAIGLKGATLKGLSMNQAADIQRDSKYPLSVIRNISSMEEYQLYKDAGLSSQMINHSPALMQHIDLKYQSDTAGKMLSNLDRLGKGLPPVDPSTGSAMELHHIGQSVDSPLAVLTQAEHRMGINYGILHDPMIQANTGVHSSLSNAEWALQRKEFWKACYRLAKAGLLK